MPTNPKFKLALELLLASFLVLFQELTLIRWLGSQIRVLAYFPNLILIAAFLGLGIGCLRAGRKSLWMLWPVSLVIITIFTYFCSKIVFTHQQASEHLWLLYYDASPDALVINNIYLPIILFFILSSISFVSLGQFVAERLESFRKISNVLVGYTWDIFGSILGIISFSIVNYLGLFPVYWFSIFLTLGLILFLHCPKKQIVFYLISALIVISTVQLSEKAKVYTPYYALNYEEKSPNSFWVMTNGSFHQHALNVHAGDPEVISDEQLVALGYNTPYRQYLQKNPEKVLILGAGTGNDVATALYNGAKQIDVVEIDPEIIKLGQKYHPNKPYASGQVRIFNQDARSYLSNTNEKYDLIVFGTLDSMTTLSALSNIRLDNFVYTKESISAAKNALTPDGGVMLLFMVGNRYIEERLSFMLSEVFQQVPVIYERNHLMFSHVYMAGNAFQHIESEKRILEYQKLPKPLDRQLKLSTDDWPYLYLKSPSLSKFYLLIMGVIGLLAIVSVFISSPTRLKSSRNNLIMFCFGLSFLLIETKSIISMNLVWGATWLTSAVVFGSILFMVLMATIISQIHQIKFPVAFAGLVISIVTMYLIPISSIIGLNLFSTLIFSILLIGLPIFFAAICFALLFNSSESAGESFGWNILGAVAGGLLEFMSMVTGLKALLLIALMFYLIALMIYVRRN